MHGANGNLFPEFVSLHVFDHRSGRCLRFGESLTIAGFLRKNKHDLIAVLRGVPPLQARDITLLGSKSLPAHRWEAVFSKKSAVWRGVNCSKRTF